MTSIDPAQVSGPNADGSKSLARESKIGQAVTFVATVGALAAVDLLGGLDVGGLPVWLQATATAAIGTAVGLLTAYNVRNRKRMTANATRPF